MDQSSRIVPIHSSMQVGLLWDARPFNALDGLQVKGYTHETREVNIWENKYSMVETIQDMCEVLHIPIEYALKVRSGIIQNEGIMAFLKTLENTESVKVVLRSTFIKETETLDISDERLKDYVAEESERIRRATHFIKEICFGSELILMLKVNKKDGNSKEVKFKDRISQKLKSRKGNIEKKFWKNFTAVETYLEDGVNDEHVTVEIHQLSFNSECMNSIAQSVEHFKNFMSDSACQAGRCSSHIQLPIYTCKIAEQTDQVLDEKKDAQTSSSETFYPLRAVLKSIHALEESPGMYIMASENKYNNDALEFLAFLYRIYFDCQDATHLYKNLYARKEFYFIVQNHQITSLIKATTSLQETIDEAILSLDMTLMDKDKIQLLKQKSNVKLDAISYCEEKTQKLPPGGEVNLMLLGKTGHGKSSTGNMILLKDVFKTYAGMDSVTIQASCESAIIDGRCINVVDIPGVSGTDSKSSIYLQDAKRYISSGIAWCRKGVNAFILLLKYDTRMPDEEQNCLQLLEKVLSDSFISSHGVFIFTMGDNFNRYEKESFYNWVRKQEHDFFKSIMDKCSYRCVLFNNKATKSEQLSKEQLVLLINYIDGLDNKPFTNEIFERANNSFKTYVESKKLSNIFFEDTIMPEIQRIWMTIEQGNPILELRISLIESIKSVVEYLERNQTDTMFSELLKTYKMVIKQAESASSPYTITEETFADLKEKTHAVVKVKNEIFKHVESSVQKDVESRGCFSGNSLLFLENGRSVRMDRLQVNDNVLVMNNKNELCFDKVYMFGHKDEKIISLFVVIHTRTNQATLTENHLILCRQVNKEHYLAAGEINVGDEILQVESGEPVWSRVTHVTRQYRQGLFAPFTRSGTIVVDGVLMSCYIDVLTHQACHRLLWPIRTLHRLAPKGLEKISRTSDKQPIPKWANLAFNLVNFTKKGKL